MSDPKLAFAQMTNMIIGISNSFALAMVALQGTYYTHIKERIKDKGEDLECDFYCFTGLMVLGGILFAGSMFCGIAVIHELRDFVFSSDAKVTEEAMKEANKFLQWQRNSTIGASSSFGIAFIISQFIDG